MIKSFTAKIGAMRKARKWVTYPRNSASEPVLVQAEGAVGRFDPVTGVGVLNVGPASKHYGFLHLNTVLGAVPFTFPPEFRAAAIDAGTISADRTVILFDKVQP